MKHQDAVRLMAVEKYVLNELSPSLRDEFEVHFFECQECAADLGATAAILDSAKRQFKRMPATRLKPFPGASRSTWLDFIFRPAFLSPAFALLLGVIVYQNVAVFPKGSANLTQPQNPEILASISLIGSNSRGSGKASVTLDKAQALLLSVDIPTSDRFSSYATKLLAPNGAVLWRLPISPQQAKDTVSIRVPATTWLPGDYNLVVQGANPGQEEPADLLHYRFNVNSPNGS